MWPNPRSLFNENWQVNAPVSGGDGWISDATRDNDDMILYSFPPVAIPTDPNELEFYSGVRGLESRIMNTGYLPGPGALGFLHAGVGWGTLSLGLPANPGDFGEAELVYLRNFADYLTGPTSPFENGLDDDRDGSSDRDAGNTNDRFGPEIRRLGRVNVNTARLQVLMAVFSRPWLASMWGGGGNAETRAGELAQAVVDERIQNGPYSSVDDLLARVPEIFEVGSDASTPPAGRTNSFRREALARFVHNLLTVRTDVWGVIGRVRLMEGGEEVGGRSFYLVLDRSRDPVRVLMSGTPPR
jgi:hypothetical protein